MNVTDLPTIDIQSPELTGSPATAAASVAEIRDEVGFARSHRGIEVLDYDGVAEVMRDVRFVPGTEQRLRGSGITEGPTYDAISGLLTGLEGERHSRCRRAAAPWFNKRTAEQLRADVRGWLAEWFDEQRDSGEFDFARVIGRRLPATVFCRLIGAPLSDAEYVARVSEDILLLTKVFGPENQEIISNACAEAITYIKTLAEERRKQPGDDLISFMVEAESKGDIGEDDILAVLLAVLSGSTDTTNTQMCLNLVTLSEHPDQLQLLRDRPELVDGAPSELLRFSPGLWSHIRSPLEPVNFRGLQVDVEDTLWPCVYSANRDPRAFDDPMELDLTRTFTKPPMNFGSGRHNCLGMVITLVEQQEIVRAVLTHWTDFEISEAGFSGAQYAVNPEKVVVKFTPAPSMVA